MFESPDLYMDDLLGILAIEKIRYDHTGFIAGESLYGDDFPVVCYDALGNVADSISADVDDCDTYIQKFCFPGMEEFYSHFVHIPCGWWVDQETRETIVNAIKAGW